MLFRVLSFESLFLPTSLKTLVPFGAMVPFEIVEKPHHGESFHYGVAVLLLYGLWTRELLAGSSC